MISVRKAKSKLENHEGMNHLWIQLHPIGDAQNVRVQIKLPPGLYRRRNLSSFFEDDAGEIVIYEPNKTDAFFIEIYTSEPVSCGSKTIVISLSYNDVNGDFIRLEHAVGMEIVEEDEMNDVCIDDEVVRLVKELQLYNEQNNNPYMNDSSLSKPLIIDPEPCSDLEKKYRIDGHIKVECCRLAVS
ncbi:hypothetical protein FHS15_001941 [Paenibacillus castaneae]|uniref:hypothetical protein n=1 Tax=Paenibacillus castaneae TaxID=474957 RepID=UPI000C9D0A19|nr:hypothetical protein [Paenibacillus castaneae]NIK76816.1 hypothetical protein [Paenibacillus castaneae]